MTRSDTDAMERTPSEPHEKITTDDLRHKALAVRGMVADEARHTLEDSTVRLAIAGAVVLVVALSAAYFLGTRAAGRARARSLPRP